MIRWADRYRTDAGSLASYVNGCTYKRVREVYKDAALFNEIGYNDIYQGRLSNCYWITATSGLGGSKSSRVEDIFLTDNYNDEGIFAVNLYIRGKKTTITVDDYLPFYGTYPLGMRMSTSGGDFWGPVLEKVWAKVNNNYESTNWGW